MITADQAGAGFPVRWTTPPRINTKPWLLVAAAILLPVLVAISLPRSRPSHAIADDPHKAGDVLVVTKLDRLTRSLSDLLRILKRLDDVGASFESLTERIETTSPPGRMMMQMLGSFAEFEREMIR